MQNSSSSESGRIVNLQSLIPLINKVQDVFNKVQSASASGPAQSLSLPEIIVVGSQSSGKSSVLESLVGKSFLPRGENLVTRCPIILQLFCILDGHESTGTRNPALAEWCEFLHKPDVVFNNFDDVRAEIIAETDRITGSRSGIVSQPITLKVYSKQVPTLTLVDLPGIVKIPVGDQPKDIEAQVKELIRNKISNPNSLILAVTPANTDLATSDGIQMAREVDPEGTRTLVVLTKLDLLESSKGVDTLSGRILPVRLGIIGVINRSQQDIKDGKTVEQALEHEDKFLRTNYSSVASRHGIPHLAKRLHQLLLEHIRTCLPQLETRVRSMLGSWQETLVNLGEKVTNMHGVIHKVVTTFSDQYRGAIDGQSRNIMNDKLAGAARIRIIYGQIFSQELQGVDPIKDLTDDAILNAIRNSSQLEAVYLAVEEAFRDLVKVQIRRLLAPSLLCVTLVEKVMKEMIDDSLDHAELKDKLDRFPVLTSNIKSIVSELIDECREKTEQMLRLYIDVQSSFVLTNNVDFNAQMAGVKDLEPMVSAGTNNLIFKEAAGGGAMLTDAQLVQCDVVRSYMQKYMQIIKDEVQNYVVRAVTHFTIYHVEKTLQTHLLDYLTDPDRVDALLQENSTVALKRDEAERMVQALEEAKSVIYEVREAK